MQRTEIEQDPAKQQINDLKIDIAKLTAQRETLEQENRRHSPLAQKLGKYIGFGAAGKLEWVCFKLNFKQEELTRLMSNPDERLNGAATLLSMTRTHPAAPATETSQQKMERMVTENPPALEPHIRQVYQALIAAGQ